MYKKAGIYKLQSRINGKIYIGESLNIIRRRIRHFTDLRNKNHTNSYLQRHVDKYGIDDIFHEIVEELPADKMILSEREKHWISYFNSNNLENGFNLNSGGLGGTIHTIIYSNFNLVKIDTGEFFHFESISDFEERTEIYTRHKIRDVLAGKRKVSTGFTTLDNYKLILNKKEKSTEKLNKVKPLPPINSKKFKLINTLNSEIYEGENISKFCREYNINYRCIIRVVNGIKVTTKNGNYLNSNIMGKEKIKWLDLPEDHDYPAAQSYLSLVFDEDIAEEIVSELMENPS